MKKYFLYFLCTGVLVVLNFINMPGISCAQTANLIINPSVEIADSTNLAPQNWTGVKTGANITIFSYPSEGAQDGKRSIKISMTQRTNGDAKWYFTPVNVTAGNTYYFYNYYKATVKTRTVLEIQDTAGKKTTQILGSNPASASWKQTQYSIKVPINTAKISIYQVLSSVGTLETDNYFLSLYPVATVTDNVPNMSLEEVDPITGQPLAWITEKNGINTTTFQYLTTSYTGSHSVKTTITKYISGSADWYFTPQPITGGKCYTFSDWYISNVPTQVSVKTYDSNGNATITKLMDAAATTVWKQYSAQICLPANAVKYTILHSLNKVGTLTVDNYSFIPLPITGSIVVTKTTIGNDGTFNFTGSSGILPFSITTTNGSGSYTISNLAPGTYTITEENLGTGWSKVTDTCSGGVVVSAGNTTVCNITNTYTPTYNNNIPNPSLEEATDQGQPQAWNHGYHWGDDTAVYTYLDTGHTGNHSVKIEITQYNTTGNEKWYFDYQPITGGQYYLVSDYYKSNIDTLVYVSVNKSDGTNQNYLLKHAPASENDWIKYSDIFWMPENAVSYSIFHSIENIGWLITDDYSFTPITYSGFNRPLVSINFDDGRKGVYVNALPLLNTYNFKTTQYIVSESLDIDEDDNDDYYMTKNQIKALYDTGHEIGSHTVNHLDLTNLDISEIDKQLLDSKTDLNNLFPPVTNFAMPYGSYNTLVINEIKKYYKSARTVDIGFNTPYNFDPYSIKIQYVNKSTSIDDIKNWLVQTTRDKSWMVLLYHGIDNPVDETDPDSISPQIFKTQLSEIQKSGLPVVTMKQALDEIIPQIRQ